MTPLFKEAMQWLKTKGITLDNLIDEMLEEMRVASGFEYADRAKDSKGPFITLMCNNKKAKARVEVHANITPAGVEVMFTNFHERISDAGVVPGKVYKNKIEFCKALLPISKSFKLLVEPFEKTTAPAAKVTLPDPKPPKIVSPTPVQEAQPTPPKSSKPTAPKPPTKSRKRPADSSL